MAETLEISAKLSNDGELKEKEGSPLICDICGITASLRTRRCWERRGGGGRKRGNGGQIRWDLELNGGWNGAVLCRLLLSSLAGGGGGRKGARRRAFGRCVGISKELDERNKDES